jgi:O-acetyl-ADP-ribose deacetylase
MIAAGQDYLSGMRLEIVRGDITRERVDAIVNAANCSLLGGGGVDGAIHRAGGPAILEECRTLGGCPTGEVRATSAGRLAARYVLHAVGPVWRGGGHGEPELLASCYRNALALARELGCASIAFPAISTGVYGYPAQAAARVAVAAIREWAAQHPASALQRITLIAFSTPAFDVLSAAIAEADAGAGEADGAATPD